MTTNLPTPDDVVAAAAQIFDHIEETPIVTAEALNAIAGANLLIKAECLQQTGSFKLRGATNRLLQIPKADRAAGVVAFSSGNHAQGVARAARRLDMPAVIIMPSDAPAIKVAGVRRDGGEVVFYERNTENREAIAAQLAEKSGAVIVPSFDDPMIIAGQGTCGLEFAGQVTDLGMSLDGLICCAGGGGLISGIALAFESLGQAPLIYTAEPEEHDDWARSIEAGEICSNAPGTRSICDAILTPQPGDLTFAIGRDRLAGGCRVSDEQVCEAVRLAHRELKITLEPGGAVALASALFALPDTLKGKTVGVVLTGGNVDPEVHDLILAGEMPQL